MNRLLIHRRLSIMVGIATFAVAVIIGFSAAPPAAAQGGQFAMYGALVYPKGIESNSCLSTVVLKDADYRNTAVNGNAAQGWDVTISQGYFNPQLGWFFIGADIDTNGTVTETDPDFLNVTFNDGLWHRFRCNRDFFGGYEVDFESVDKLVHSGAVYNRVGPAWVNFVASSFVRAMDREECHGFNKQCTTGLTFNLLPNQFDSDHYVFREN